MAANINEIAEIQKHCEFVTIEHEEPANIC